VDVPAARAASMRLTERFHRAPMPDVDSLSLSVMLDAERQRRFGVFYRAMHRAGQRSAQNS
jgi:hypothetical protein